MSIGIRLSASAIVAAAFVVPVAHAAVGGGGATLPAHAYQGANASVDATGPRLSQPASRSLFKVALGTVASSYCQTGSGGGRAVLTSASGNTDDTRPCPASFTDSFVNGTNGFSAPTVDADFAASDAPASGTDFTNYVTFEGGQHTQLTQFPSLVGNVAVVFHNSNVTGLQKVYLTEAELCNIWSGRITNWNQIVRNTGAPYPSKPITLVYRSDSSGTSFGFSNHLNWVCQDGSLDQDLAAAAAPLPFAVGDNFSVNSVFSSAFPVNTGVPAGSVAASGNPGVVSQVEAIEGAIGYAEAANVIALDSDNVKVAYIAAVDTVASLDPAPPNNRRVTSKYKAATKNAKVFTLPATFVDKDGATYSSVYTDRALQANNVTYGRPVGLGTALTPAQAPNPNCAFLVQPGAYATSVYSTAGTPTSGYKFYPIGVATYLMGNYSGNQSVASVRKLLASPYNTAIRTTVNSVGANTGYSYLGPITATPLTGANVALDVARVNGCTN